ncbi:MAG: hypothetical protein ACYSW3_28515 [Planctomycetota bacterium]
MFDIPTSKKNSLQMAEEADLYEAFLLLSANKALARLENQPLK